MVNRFEVLVEEKRLKILNAAIEEFAMRGYDDASTVNIAKNAGISKGLLFHYFGTKRGLLNYLVDYVLEKIRTEYNDLINMDERDVFQRLQQNYLLKLELLQRHPRLFEFGKVLIGSAFDQFAKTVEYSFENIDTSRFRDDIDPKKAVKIIAWAVTGYINQFIEETGHLIDYDRAMSEFDSYMSTLERCFYKCTPSLAPVISTKHRSM